MGVEIERKFLIKLEQLPALPAATRLSQGYLCEAPAVRVRVAHDDMRAWLTIKGPKRSGGIAVAEFEYPIPFPDGEQLLKLCKTQLHKVRTEYEYRGHTWEIDRFLDNLSGLYVAEIELDREDESFARPPWLGQEVTNDVRYTNVSLAANGIPT